MVRVGVWSRVSVSKTAPVVTFCHSEASEIISSEEIKPLIFITLISPNQSPLNLLNIV